MLDEIHPLTEVLAKLLPDEGWQEDEQIFNLSIPLAVKTTKPHDEIPKLHIKLNKEQYLYIKENG